MPGILQSKKGTKFSFLELLVWYCTFFYGPLLWKNIQMSRNKIWQLSFRRCFNKTAVISLWLFLKETFKDYKGWKSLYILELIQQKLLVVRVKWKIYLSCSTEQFSQHHCWQLQDLHQFLSILQPDNFWYWQ